MKTLEKVNSILSAAATNGEDIKTLQTLRVMCNSDSAFVACINKYKGYQKLLQKAFLLSRTWFGLGIARTWKITLKSLKAALLKLSQAIKGLCDFNKMPEFIRKQIIKVVDKAMFQESLSF